MKNAEQKEEYSLSASTIDAIAQKVEQICDENNLDKKSKTRVRLSVEESLLVWMNAFGEGKKVVFKFGYRFFRPYFQVAVEGNALNPYNAQSEDFGEGGKSLLVNIGLIPTYAYFNGQNSLTFTMKKERKNPLLSLLIIISSAVFVGIMGKLFLPATVITTISDQIISPISNAFLNVLKATAGPMIFLSIAWGIFGIGDVYSLGKIGKKLMISFLFVVFGFTFFGAFFFPLFGKSLSGGVTQFNQFGVVFKMILDIIPDNIFSPFVEGNTLQIIFLGLIVGISLIFLGQRTSAVAKAVQQINHIVNFLMTFISKLVPYFVFIVLVLIIWSDSFKSLLSVWKFVLIFLGVSALFITIRLCIVAFKNHTSPLKLFKKCLPSYMLALTTASSAATFESNMTICKKEFGIDNSMASFGVPLGTVLFKPNSALYYLLLCFYFSTVYNIEVTFSWIIIAIIITAVCAVATPPIPGGAAATYSLLLLQLGIPVEAVAVAVAVDMVFDFILTSDDMLCLLVELYGVSSRLGMRHDVAQKPSAK